MCSGTKSKPDSAGLVMEAERHKLEGFSVTISLLLELAAFDNLLGFRAAVEEEGRDVDEVGLWYGRKIGSMKMGFEERTPLMVAAMYGSKDVLSYILETRRVDLNRACGSDGATALHCAVAGGSASAVDIVKALLDASADPNSIDAKGNRPGDLIFPAYRSAFGLRRKKLEVVLKRKSGVGEACDLATQGMESDGQVKRESVAVPLKEVTEKKEYPVDHSLPDIKNGIYGTDEFRMYTFKIKPCSRAYSHDWTECPFVHPGENARRRDPRKYHYSCVPCPEFRKGSCSKGDNCEYAHGIFECWLHPAQYRTRLCKDETNCTRKVCFFAHKLEELRPLYASTGSAIPSPKSYPTPSASLEMGSMSPLGLGSSSVLTPASTPPLTPAVCSSPMGGTMWQNISGVAPPTLQLPGSRLKTALSARDMDVDMGLLGLDGHRRLKQQLVDDISGLPLAGRNTSLSTASVFAASPGDQSLDLSKFSGLQPTNLDKIFGSLDPAVLTQLQGLSLDAAAAASQLHSPTSIHVCQQQQQQQQQQLLRSSYSSGLSASPVRPSPFSTDPSLAAKGTALNSRSAVFTKRSQSFIERDYLNRLSGFSSPSALPSSFPDWSSPDGKLDWGVQGGELEKLRRCSSFGMRSNGRSSPSATTTMANTLDEPDVSWVQSLVKDAPSVNSEQYHLNAGGLDMVPAWLEQLYMEQEQMVA